MTAVAAHTPRMDPIRASAVWLSRRTCFEIGVAFTASFFVLAVLYGLMIPAWLPYDEPAHFYYAAHLAGLPGFPVPGATHIIYEARKQPPLAYLLYVPFLRLTSTDTYTTQLSLLRIVTATISALAVAANLAIVAQLTRGMRHCRALFTTAGALLVFNPAYIADSAALSNDALFNLLAALSVLVGLRFVIAGSREAEWSGIALAIIVGLAGATKALGLPLLALPVLLLAVRVRCNGRVDLSLKRLAGALAVGAIVACIPYVQDQIMYHDPFGTRFWRSISSSHPMRLRDIPRIPALFVSSYWLFVTFLRDLLVIRPSRLEYAPFFLLSIAPLALLTRRTDPDLRRRPAVWVALIVVSLALVAFVLKNIEDYGPEGRYLFGVAGPLAWLIACGVQALLPEGGRRRVLLLGAVTAYVSLYGCYASVRYLTHAPLQYSNIYYRERSLSPVGPTVYIPRVRDGAHRDTGRP